MFKKLKIWVISKTIQYAESRYSIFVWMRQINDRIMKLEEGQTDKAIQQVAETEMRIDAKIQNVEGSVGLLQANVEELKYNFDRISAQIEELKNGL